MCGIAGIFNLNQAPVSEYTLKRMTDILAHRGPDGAGYFLENGVGLGHRRLSILDLSDKGKQPMVSRDGTWAVAFNGCIYNFREIRAELQGMGHTFSSTTDTEVIVEGLSAWGVSVFEKFNGMFAVAAWNRKTKKLYLVRDRFGVKPLYYWFSKGKIAFASEIKAILEHPDYQIDVNPRALNEYFSFQNLFSFQTLFQGICMVPPANTFEISTETQEIRHNSWWDYDFTRPDNAMSFEDAVDETKRNFERAVTRQMVADVPVGAYLSGGMDSGSITAIASSQVSRLATFTCGFDMSGVTGVEANYDERRAAEVMAANLRTEHYEQVINAGDLGWGLPRVVWHLEDLRVGMSYPNYYISRLASKFVKVCLQGTGGDELFGGYPWRYYRVFRSVSQEEFFDSYYSFWQRLVSDEHKKLLFRDHIYDRIDVEEPRTIFKRVFTFNDRLRYDTPEEQIQNSLYFEIKTFLHGLLIVGDKLSMANGLEERFPFLDNDLIDLAQRIPVRHKLGNMENLKKIDENELRKRMQYYQDFDDGKSVLRKAMTSFLPESILNRKKQGFSAPEESWYRGENARFVQDTLCNPKAASHEFINPAYIRRIIDEHVNQKINHRLLIWSLLCFEYWCQIFLEGKRPDF